LRTEYCVQCHFIFSDFRETAQLKENFFYIERIRYVS